MKLAEIAERIRAHLNRFEADPKSADTYRGVSVTTFARHLIAPSSRYVYVAYVDSEWEWQIGKDEALAYLAWLDAGNVGRHHEQQREAAEKAK